MNSNNEYLGVPFEEKLVPFPNFASVLLQHAREFPIKIALSFKDTDITYSQLLQFCITAEIKECYEQDLTFGNARTDLLPLLVMLYRGTPFKLNFERNVKDVDEYQIGDINEIDFFDPPHVKLDDKAFVLNGEYEFSQYNVLVAAQAVGQAFKLFRDGAAYCPKSVFGIEDMIFGILAPLYFAKSIYFYEIDKPDFFQYAWNGVIESNLRDAVMVTNEVNYHENVFRLRNNFEEALGLGEAIGPDGKAVQFLGFEIIDGEPGGHCLGRKVL
jgi:hypothetical protein